MTSTLVGSEMCIRDRRRCCLDWSRDQTPSLMHNRPLLGGSGAVLIPVSYTHLTLPTICSV
eukprot:2063057-Prorocentrum_lima.AAC.1